MIPDRRDLTLNISGLRYHLNEWDGGGGTTVLFLHGFLDLGQNWSFVVEALGDTSLHLVAPDWRGHGDSEWIGPGGYYHFPDYVRDLEQIVHQIRRQKLVVVGHSMGAMVATLWAGARPDALDGLVLVDGTGPMPVSAQDYPMRFQRWLEQTAPFDQDDFRRPMDDLDHVMRRISRARPQIDAELVRRISQFSTRCVGEKLYWKYDPLHRTQSPMPMLPTIVGEFWSRVRCPILWVGGETSPWNLPQVHEWLDIKPQLDRRMIPGVGHQVQNEGVAELAHELVEFIRKHRLE